MTTTQDIVAKLWNLCHVLRDDGMTYHEYVTELTFLLFLKMMEETGAARSSFPKGYRWDDLAAQEGVEQLDFYRALLRRTWATEGVASRVQAIFTNARHRAAQAHEPQEAGRQPSTSSTGSPPARKGLGDLYEGLAGEERQREEVRRRAVFHAAPADRLHGPPDQAAAGRDHPGPGGRHRRLPVAADRYIKERHRRSVRPDRGAAELPAQASAYVGVELVPDTHRLCLMNLMLHGIEGDMVLGDTLSPEGAGLPKADLILTNPPFGTKKGGGRPTRDDFTYRHLEQAARLPRSTSIRALKPGGRAAVVVPDNVLFEEGTGRSIRADLMDKCDLHTILRLPTGIFYAQGVKTNVLFFTRGKTDKGNTKAVWVYDLRTNMPAFGKTRPLTREHFAEFEKAFGDDPYGKAERNDQGEEGRFRCFTRDDIAERGDNLDITWLRDDERGRRQPDRPGDHRRRDHRTPAHGAGGDGGADGRTGRRGTGGDENGLGGGRMTADLPQVGR